MAKRLVRDLGLPTADFVMVTHPEEADTVALAPPLFAKPIAEGSSKGIDGHSKVANREELRRACGELLQAFGQPVLVESYLPGREVTVGIVGNGAAAIPVGTMEIAFTQGCDREFYTALNKGEFEERVSYRLLDGEPLGERARQIALAVYHALGCRDAARIDLRCDAAGEPQFLEVNPLPGLHPTRSDLPIMCKLGGIDYRELLTRIVAAAAERWGL
jgi:D-alanine-D-alanine ligase